MKRVLSFIIALTMFAAVLQTFVLAAPATEFTADFSTVNTSTLKSGQYPVAGKAAKGTNWSINTDNTVSTILKNNSTIRIYQSVFGNTFAQFGFNDTLLENGYNTAVIDVTVPSTGWYDVDAMAYKTSFGGVGDIYLDGKKECTYDFYSTLGEGTDAADTYGRKNEIIDITSKPVLLTQGTHEIKIVGQKTQRKEKDNTYQYVSLNYFKFTPVSNVQEVSFVMDSTTFGKAYSALAEDQIPTLKNNGWALNDAASAGLLARTVMRPYGLQIQSSMNESYTYLTLDFDVAVSGNYDLALTYSKYNAGGYGGVYVDDKYVGEVDYYAASAADGNYEELRPLNLSAGTHTITFAVNRNNETGGLVNMYPSSLMLISQESLSALTSAVLTISNTELTSGDTVVPEYTLTYANGAEADAKTYSGANDDTVTVKLTSSNPSAVKVVNNSLVAVGGGTAEISATVTVDGTSVNTNAVTVSAVESEKNTVSFCQTTNIDGYNDLSVESVARGDAVDLTAHKMNIDGYKFVGWKRGADESSMDTWADISGDTYNVWTNTYLTAVYEKADNTSKSVEFWNQNGAYIGKMDEETYNAQETLFTPKLTGFGTFLGWFTDGNVKFEAKQELSKGTTNVVAQYEASSVSGVTLDDSPVSGADTYNKKVEFQKTNDNFTCWKRDGKIVSYSDTYTYYVWDATNVTEGTEEIVDRAPVIILEYSDTHDAYMIEYDEGAYEIVEAGIIFGSGSHTVDACDKKFTSQRKVSHNQFTAPAQSGKTAIGYIIWKDSMGNYQVKYAEAE